MPYYERTTKADLPTILSWINASDVNWNYSLSILESIYDTCPEGWLSIRDEDGTLLGNSYCGRLNESITCAGVFVVRKMQRGQGIGSTLRKQHMELLGPTNLVVNAIEHRVESNKRLGYKVISWRGEGFTGKLRPIRLYPQPDDVKVVPASDVSLDHLMQYDTPIHTVPRDKFHLYWTLREAFSLVALRGHHIVGYGTVKPAFEGKGFRLGPLYADEPGVAQTLLNAFAAHTQDGQVLIDVVTDNEAMRAVLNELGCSSVYKMVRMYFNEEVPLPLMWKVYAISNVDNMLL